MIVSHQNTRNCIKGRLRTSAVDHCVYLLLLCMSDVREMLGWARSRWMDGGREGVKLSLPSISKGREVLVSRQEFRSDACMSRS